MKVRRVGSITGGTILILIGVLCLIHIFYPALQYEYILRGWPLILILIGVEMLIANVANTEQMEIKYDVAAIVLVFILVIFAMCMGFLEYVVDHYGWSLYLMKL